MRLALVGLATTIALALGVGTAASDPTAAAPRLFLSARAAPPDADVTVRVGRVPASARGAIRLYLVEATHVASVRSRLDPRLAFLGTIRAASGAKVTVRVPPVDPGRYALAHWCAGCLPKGVRIHALRTPRLDVFRPVGDGCPVTRLSTSGLPGVSNAWAIRGNGWLWALAGPAGITTNPLGGAKLPWIARPGLDGRLEVRYRRLDEAGGERVATTVSGRLAGYLGPSWASRMSFEPGCWRIAGRVRDVSTSFVVRVERGPR